MKIEIFLEVFQYGFYVLIANFTIYKFSYNNISKICLHFHEDS